MKKQINDFINDWIEAFGVAVKTVGLILVVTVLCTMAAFIIFKFILFIVSRI
jgi:hypothetical protein